MFKITISIYWVIIVTIVGPAKKKSPSYFFSGSAGKSRVRARPPCRKIETLAQGASTALI